MQISLYFHKIHLQIYEPFSQNKSHLIWIVILVVPIQKCVQWLQQLTNMAIININKT